MNYYSAPIHSPGSFNPTGTAKTKEAFSHACRMTCGAKQMLGEEFDQTVGTNAIYPARYRYGAEQWAISSFGDRAE